MGVRVAYGKRNKIADAIESGIIPKDSIIITDDSNESELFFYDVDANLKPISERKSFYTLSEAQSWIKEFDCVGNIISVHNGADWVPYIVTENNNLKPITGDSGTITDITVIDGGTASGQ